MTQVGVYSDQAWDNPMSFIGNNNKISLVGDSLTWLQYNAPALAAKLPECIIINRGEGGETVAQITARMPGQVLSLTNVGAVLVMAGINDVQAGRTAAQIEGDLQALYNLINAAGFRVIAITMLPFGHAGSWTAGRQAVLDDVNVWIVATAINCYGKLDCYAEMEDPADPDCLFPAYDFGDGIHLSTAGNAALQIYEADNIAWNFK